MFVDSFRCMTLQLLLHIGGFLPLGSILLECVGEEEYLQDGENNKQFYQYHQPKGLSQRHISESIIVEIPNSIK